MDNFQIVHQAGLLMPDEQELRPIETECSETKTRTKLPSNTLTSLRILRGTNVSLERKLNHFGTIPDEYIEYWNRYQKIVIMEEGHDQMIGLNLGGLMLRIVNIIPFLELCQYNGIQLQIINLGGTDVQMDNLLKGLQAYQDNVSSLKELYLGGCSISCFKKIAQLAQVLKACTSLTTLDLRYNDLLDSDIGQIVSMLNKSVKTLHLEGNQLECDGAKAIADILSRSSTTCSIQELYLGANNIGPKGAQYLANSLLTNSSLTKLYLEGNKIGDDGAKAFTEVFIDQANRKCKTLQHLYVSNNGLGKDVAIELGRAVNHESVIDGSLF